MKKITINLAQMEDFDPQDRKVPKKKVIMPKPQSQLPGEETLLESAVKIYSELDKPYAKVLGEMLDFTKPPTGKVTTVGKPKGFLVPPPGKDITLTLGPSATAGAGVSIGISGGIFFSTASPHVGLYGSIDYGIVTDIGAAFVGQVMILFGSSTAMLKGPPTILVGVNVAGPKVIAASGFLVYHETSPAWTLVGVGFSLGVGASVLPVSVFVTKSVGGVVHF
jgi:hypothetical protein